MRYGLGGRYSIGATFQRRLGLEATAVFVLTGMVPAAVSAQQSSAGTAPLVFDAVTVIDVEHGKLLEDQRVVIEGNHIRAVGNRSAVSLPTGAQVVPAYGKYLIPGLWDMHLHLGYPALLRQDSDGSFETLSGNLIPSDVSEQLLIVQGVTGFRDAYSYDTPLDTLVQWQREILAGTRVGPPRQLLAGVAIYSDTSTHWSPPFTGGATVASGDSAAVDSLVRALKHTGATWLKLKQVDAKTYFLLANAARRYGLRFGGHIEQVSPLDAADSGATLIDHTGPENVGIFDSLCFNPDKATVATCRPVAEKFQRTNTWSVPTLSFRAIQGSVAAIPNNIRTLLVDAVENFWANFTYNPRWPKDHTPIPAPATPDTLHFAYLKIAAEVGLPLLVGGDTGGAEAGFKTHAEMAILVDRGLTPLAALQAATLNPARAIQATDSLGTVAAGKLADLVVLDANPLVDITNTTMIHAVVANGRYFDRAALDELVAQIQTEVQ